MHLRGVAQNKNILKKFALIVINCKFGQFLHFFRTVMARLNLASLLQEQEVGRHKIIL